MTRSAILHVTSMRRCGDHSLRLRFSDGCEKRVNLLQLLDRGAFRALRDPRQFARVRLDRKWGTICWPGDLDFAPEALRDLPEEPEPESGTRPRRRAER